MSCQTSGTAAFQVRVTSTTLWRYEFMEPMLLVGGEVVDVTLDVQQDGSDLVEAVPVVQYYAVRKDVPGTPSLFSGSATNSRSKYSATLTSSSNMYARIGIATRLTSGSAAQGLVRLYWAKSACGYAVGSATAQLEGMAANAPSYLILGRKQPTRGVTAFKASAFIPVRSADVYTRLVTRLYTNDPQTPGLWLAGLEAQYTAQDVARNTTELATSGVTDFSDAMWYDLALQLMSPSANTVATVLASAVAKL